jgi:hypothetical protein
MKARKLIRSLVKEVEQEKYMWCDDCDRGWWTTKSTCPWCAEKMRENPRLQVKKSGTSVVKAKDETDIHNKKGTVYSREKYNQRTWDWRIHNKGSYWYLGDSPWVGDKKWGARALSGEVDYFPTKELAMKFADYQFSPKDAWDFYKRGSFTGESVRLTKPMLENLIREEVRRVRKVLKEGDYEAVINVRRALLNRLRKLNIPQSEYQALEKLVYDLQHAAALEAAARHEIA